MEKKRLLCIVSSMDVGGAETFLMKIYRALDKTKYQMDFYCMSQKVGYYEEEIKKLGGRIFHSYPKSKYPIRSFVNLVKTVKKERYHYVLRVSQHSLATIDLFAATLGGAKVLAQRSSNSDSGSFLSRKLHNMFKWLPKLIPTVKLAPSTEAAEYTFGKNCVKKGEVFILKNAIPIENFTFNVERRNKVRKELGIQNKFVVGHVGRFAHQKNHSFLIDIFSEIVKMNSESVLLLVGEGELKSEIEGKIKELNLDDKVLFLGVRSDVADLMMAMDVFVFPSLFEGLPNSVIEAQATGLPCIISSNITKEVKVTELVKFMSINENPEQWAINALQYKNGYQRKDMTLQLTKNGYNIKDVTRKFEKIVFEVWILYFKKYLNTFIDEILIWIVVESLSTVNISDITFF